MDTPVEVGEPCLQAVRIGWPRHPVYARRCPPLQVVVAAAEQVDVDVMQQGGEPQLHVSLRCFTYTVQPAWPAVPAGHPVRVRLFRILLTQRPSLRDLLRPSPASVRPSAPLILAISELINFMDTQPTCAPVQRFKCVVTAALYPGRVPAPRGTIPIEVAFTTAVTCSPSRRRISSPDCRVTMAVSRKPQSSATRASGPSGVTEIMRAAKRLRALVGLAGAFRSIVTLSARMHANTSALAPAVSTATRQACPISTVTKPALLESTRAGQM